MLIRIIIEDEGVNQKNETIFKLRKETKYERDKDLGI